MIDTIKHILLSQFDFVGFVSVQRYLDTRALSHDLTKEEQHFLKNHQSIAVVGLSYPKTPVAHKGLGYGTLSRYSYGIDYHTVMKKAFEKVQPHLLNNDIHALFTVDTSPIKERLAAALTYQGYIGKNQAFIHHKYGPYVYLGTLLLDCVLDDSILDVDSCKTCRKCIDACPTNALDDGFELSKCLSYITQAKAPLKPDQINHLKTMVYGCDVCYQVCPKAVNNSDSNPAFNPTGIENVDLVKLLTQSNKSYLKTYQNNASSWRGATVLRKNALALLYNQKYPDLEALIKSTLHKYAAPYYQETAAYILKILKES